MKFLCFLAVLALVSSSNNIADAENLQNDTRNLSISEQVDHGLGAKSITDVLTSEKYDPHQPPSINVTKAFAAIRIMDTPTLDNANEKINLRLLIDIRWHESRLRDIGNDSIIKPNKNNMTVLAKRFYEQIWSPLVLLFLSDELIMMPPFPSFENKRTIFVNRAGIIIVYALLDVNPSCSLDYSYYPADKHTCELEWNTQPKHLADMMVNYFGGNENSDYFVEPEIIEDEYRLNDKIEKVEVVKSFTFRRKLGFHILQNYIPSALIVIVSLFSFSMHAEASSDRLSLITVTLLTLVAWFSTVRESVPKVSYIKAIDVWMVVCIVFVVFILLENIMILNMVQGKDSSEQRQAAMTSRKMRKRNATFFLGRLLMLPRIKKENEYWVESHVSRNTYRVGESETGSGDNCGCDETEEERRNLLKAKKIDRICLILGSLFFVCFVVAYWVCILVWGQGFTFGIFWNSKLEVN